MNFDPTTNRIPFGLLTPEEQATLKAWPHKVEYYSHKFNKGWVECEPVWDMGVVYRSKPAPKVKSYWFNLYDGDRVGKMWNSREGLSRSNGGVLMRMDICNGEVTVTKGT